MISKIRIKGLYDIYNYDIDFSKNGKVLILTGPNGYGKTTILQIINHFCQGKFWLFYYLNFQLIELSFDDGFSFAITKNGVQLVGAQYKSAIIDMYDAQGKQVEWGNIDETYIETLLQNIREYESSILPEKIDILLEQYCLPRMKEKANLRLAKIYEYTLLLDCVMIEEQRLISNKLLRTIIPVRTVEDIQTNIHKFFVDAQRTYNSASLKIDGTFVKRLSDSKPVQNAKSISKEKIYNQVVKKIAEYQKFGLVGELNVVSNLGVHYHAVLKLYLKDLYDKLESIDGYYRKLALFDKIVSGKHLSNKKLKFEKDEMVIVDKNDIEIPIHKLSSGEQNLLVLCYKVVFEMNDNHILLVDEPENSMHIAWLKHLLDDYILVSEETGCQIIIATHSPSFISGRWDLTYDLCENGAC